MLRRRARFYIGFQSMIITEVGQLVEKHWSIVLYINETFPVVVEHGLPPVIADPGHGPADKRRQNFIAA